MRTLPDRLKLRLPAGGSVPMQPAVYRELGTRVLRRSYPDGWGQAYGSTDEDG
jgi:hypothetical protein